MTLPGSIREELKIVFNEFDRNGDGKLSADEFRDVHSTLGWELSPEESCRIMNEMDQDGNGYIDFDEFVEFHSPSDGDGVVLKDAFDLFDVEKKGQISAVGLHSIMKKLLRLGEKYSMKDCAKMISQFDTDGDGMVNFKEFEEMMTCSRRTEVTQCRKRLEKDSNLQLKRLEKDSNQLRIEEKRRILHGICGCTLIHSFIRKGYQDEECRYAWMFLALETISFSLDTWAGRHWGFSVASVFLSAVILLTATWLYCSRRERTEAANKETERLIAVEIFFGIIQLVVSGYCFQMTVLQGVYTSYRASLFPLAYAIIAVMYAYY